MKTKFEDLPYAVDALEPVISARTVDLHYNKHHHGYYKNLKRMIEDTSMEDMSLIDILRKTKNPMIYNNAAQVYNHDMFWKSLRSKDTEHHMPEEVDSVIKTTYGTLAQLKDILVERAARHFASGWVWLVKATHEIEIWTTHDAQTPADEPDVTPLFVIDLWEHAYYLDYQNDRKQYLNAVFDIIDWEFVAKNLEVG